MRYGSVADWLLAGFAGCLLTLVLLSPAGAQESDGPGQATSGYQDPAAIPQRLPLADVEPVYRSPSIDSLATIRKRGTLRVGVAISDPMVMHDVNGELIGFSVDIARKLAEDLGVEVRFVRTAWSQIIQDLLNHRFDVIISGLWVTPTRALVVNYTDPTVTEGVYLIANEKLIADLPTLADFNQPEVKIAVYADSFQERVARHQFPRAELMRVSGDELQLTPVLEGEAHAVLIPTFAPDLVVNAAPEQLILPFDQPLSSTFAAMGLRKGDADFLNYLNTWLAFQRDQGWLAGRVHHWSSTIEWMQ